MNFFVNSKYLFFIFINVSLYSLLVSIFHFFAPAFVGFRLL